MKILVCISQVPDTTTKVTFTDNNTKFNTQGVQFIINPYDELALTRALEITEKQGGTVSVISVGLADTEPSIRKALAIGAHEAIRINAEPIDGFFVAEQIANYAKNENFDLIFTGRESIDYNGGMVAGLLGEMLNMPSVNVITAIEIENGVAHLERDIDGGREKLTATLPCVVSAQKELTEPRIPNMRGITTSYELPAPKGACKLIDVADAGKLIELLHQEAKVI
jgi:electron transfer flavoprotein beta subunit